MAEELVIPAEGQKRRMSDFKEMDDHDLLILTARSVSSLVESLDQLKTTIMGDGNGNPGLRMRIDRLELRIDRMEKSLFWLGGIIGTLVVVFLWGVFTGEILVTFK